MTSANINKNWIPKHTATQHFEHQDPGRPTLKASRVPSSRIGRLFEYGGLAVGVGVGAATEAMRRMVGASSTGVGGSLILTKSNVQRIVDRLSRMRGAALKMGQMMSIQDSAMMPPEFDQILLRVQNSANYMPDSQLDQAMSKELGSSWRDLFVSFDSMPIAAASIGQVHRASIVMPPSWISEDEGGLKWKKDDIVEVAVKVQYPGVAASIQSDLDYVKALATMGSILPKGMYLDNTIRVARMELGWECDYVREADAMERFASFLKLEVDRKLGRGDIGLANFFAVPKPVREISTGKVLVSEFVQGISVGKVGSLDKRVRDEIGDKILLLCLKELFQFRFMQTDPNWTNFFYDPSKHKMHLLDFGAAREFSRDFTEPYRKVLIAAASGDREGCIKWSTELGFLTGLESEVMQTAHVKSLMALAEPFAKSYGGKRFSFHNQDITARVRGEIPVMLRERLTPPPDESYSLHRKLSGAFLLCARIGANVRCRDVFEEVVGKI
ncbi:hypothetical protein HDU97_002998 [Phlyctochytrium planicorne]|nr:hypothetical protein HDU97_002998 [Phlyctochytrium planicorne]